MKKILMLFLFVFSFIQTHAQQKVKELTQMQQVMKVHDQVMEQDMGKTVKLIGRLETKLKSTDSPHTYEQAIANLKTVNKTMVDWMQSFGQRFSVDEMYKGKSLSQQKKKWLNEEEVKLLTMKKQINASIKKAESVLSEK